MASVTLDRVSKRWGGFVGVDAVSLDVADGEFVVLLGPSGCGKTTTMRMIAGLEEPTAGEIRIDERVVNDLPPGDRDLAMVFQNYGLYPHMTVAENIGYPLKVRARAEGRAGGAGAAAAERVELVDAPRPPAGRAVGRPAAAGGAGARHRRARRACSSWTSRSPTSTRSSASTMRAQLKHLQRELAITTIYVTHDQVEAMTLADRDRGDEARACCSRSARPLDIYDRPANTFVAGFLGSPPMNLLRGEAADGLFRHPAAAADVAVARGWARHPRPASRGAEPGGARRGRPDRHGLLGRAPGRFHPGHGRGRPRPRRGQGRQDLPGPHGRPGRRGAGPHPAPPVRARGRDATRPARAALSEGGTPCASPPPRRPCSRPSAPRSSSTASSPHRGCSTRKASRSVPDGEVWCGSENGQILQIAPRRLADRGDRQHGRLHARPRLRRRGGPLRVRPQARLRLPPRPREPAARALHPARDRDPELPRGRSGAGLPLRLGQPPLRRSRARVSGATTSGAARAGSGTTDR